MLGGKVVERQQLVLVVRDLLDGLGVFRVLLPGEDGDGFAGLVRVLGVVDVLHRALGRGLGRLR